MRRDLSQHPNNNVFGSRLNRWKLMTTISIVECWKLDLSLSSETCCTFHSRHSRRASTQHLQQVSIRWMSCHVISCSLIRRHHHLGIHDATHDNSLALALSFKRLCQSTWWLACTKASNDTTLSNPANFMPPMRTSLFYAARCKAGVAIAVVMKSSEFWSECGHAKRFFLPEFLAEWSDF